jgi:hypothetical protein
MQRLEGRIFHCLDAVFKQIGDLLKQAERFIQHQQPPRVAFLLSQIANGGNA